MDKDRFTELFWKKVDIGDELECWNWKGYTKPNEYGEWRHTYDDFTSRYAHRISYYITYGEFDTDLLVCHTCDNPSCVNPMHLFLGTNSDNMQDMSSKGRAYYQKHPEMILRGEEHWNYGIKRDYIKGENHPQSKLDWDSVKEIRRLNKEEGFGKTRLSKMFGVGRTTVSRILKGETWEE